jgi:hypothetical protein
VINIEHIEEHGGGSSVRLNVGPQVVRGDKDQDLLQRAARVTSTDRGERCNEVIGMRSYCTCVRDIISLSALTVMRDAMESNEACL